MAVIKRFDFHGSFYSMRPFIIEVNSGASGEFTIPTNSSYVYNYDVSSSDGQMFSGVTGDLTITFLNTNTNYFIEIRGVFPAIRINNNSEKSQALDVKQWGDIEWKSFNYSYYGCLNLQVSAIDTPNVSNVTDFSGVFRDTNVNINVNSWDFSEMTRCSGGWFWNGVWDNGGVPLDISIPKLGSFSGTANDTTFLFYQSPIQEITLRDISYPLNLNSTSLGCPNLVKLEAFGNFSSVDITQTALTGSAIDDLANSVRDLTGQTQSTVTMTTAQYNSGIDTTIWTNKNWAIAQV